MPTYDYGCTSCENEQEVMHGMEESPQVLCEKCSSDMKKKISLGHGGYSMRSDGTRKRDYKTRYGGKHVSTDRTMTPMESAFEKGKIVEAERIEQANLASDDVYRDFR